MDTPATRFGELLKQGMWAIRHKENKLIGAICDEIGYALGRKGGSIVEHWAKGNLPPTLEDVEELARIIVHRGGVDQTWMIDFLNSAGHPNGINLCDELFPTTNVHAPEVRESVHRNASLTVLAPITSVALSRHEVDNWQSVIETSLESPIYSRLFGIDDYVKRLKGYLLASDDVWIIALQGMGGLGKTTLADYTVRLPEMAQKFANIVWMDFKQYAYVPEYGSISTDRTPFDIEAFVENLATQLHLPETRSLPPRQKQSAIVHHLRGVSCLIVLDNLEDAPDNHQLIPFLRALTRPSKVIITSRHSLPSYGDIANIRLEQLSQQDAGEFLRHLANVHGATHLAGATDAQLDQIYALVGGNPLALRVVVSQILALSLPIVLQNLRQIPDSEVDTFYDYIFRYSWELLTSDSQKLLKSMPLVDNASIAQLIAIADLNATDLHASLRQLVRMSLIEAHGGLEERRYATYRLTETFLQKKAIDWHAVKSQSHGPLTIQFAHGVQHNLDYWQGWLEQNSTATKLNIEWPAIVKAIVSGLNFPNALPATYALIEQFSLYMEQRGQWETWSHVLSRAIETAEQSVDISLLPRLSILYARLLRRQSHYQGAASGYLRAIQLARQAQDQFTKARAWTNLGHLYIELDYWWRAEVLCVYALQLFEQVDSNHGRAHTHNHLGILYTRQGRWDDAHCHLTKAFTLWQEMGSEHGLFIVNINLGKLVNDMRTEGIERSYITGHYLEEAMRYSEQTADEVLAGIARMNMGITHRLDGNIQAAECAFLASEVVFDRHGDALGLALIADNLGIIRASQQRTDEAITYFQRALEKWQEVKSIYGEIRTMLYLADYEAGLKNQEHPKAWLKKAHKALNQSDYATKYQALYTKYQELSRSLQGPAGASEQKVTVLNIFLSLKP